MKVLSRILDIDVNYGAINFHPKCKRVNLTHLSFADDLLIFVKGLQLNASKTKVFMEGVPAAEVAYMLQVTGFKARQLHICYLGVHLLSIIDCKLIIEKIFNKLHQWSSRHLSFAGRIQLIKAVLFGIQAFWSRQFLFPRLINRVLGSSRRVATSKLLVRGLVGEISAYPSLKED
ncbi:LINE-1 retrotransposable element ORF2 protein [Gossypium australe]|uniref:LINE-1 retrotransposable element ORF2 protein n=1 Tax=Gossypium australe TaxID=47621 RepID=A0A5B6W6L5_9ROSI|nr:LINE-1 retrotransposable element ORF2 protein [Gossypium australe]